MAWISAERESLLPEEDPCYSICPEICVEVISPSNTEAEMQEKMELYFAAGAEEVWFCEDGALRFHLSANAEPVTGSQRCPEMGSRITI